MERVAKEIYPKLRSGRDLWDFFVVVVVYRYTAQFMHGWGMAGPPQWGPIGCASMGRRAAGSCPVGGQSGAKLARGVGLIGARIRLVGCCIA